MCPCVVGGKKEEESVYVCVCVLGELAGDLCVEEEAKGDGVCRVPSLDVHVFPFEGLQGEVGVLLRPGK